MRYQLVGQTQNNIIMGHFQEDKELIANAVISDVTEHKYSSGHIEYRLWSKGGYIVLEEDEYLSILYKGIEDDCESNIFDGTPDYARM